MVVNVLNCPNAHVHNCLLLAVIPPAFHGMTFVSGADDMLVICSKIDHPIVVMLSNAFCLQCFSQPKMALHLCQLQLQSLRPVQSCSDVCFCNACVSCLKLSPDSCAKMLSMLKTPCVCMLKG